MVSTRRHRKKTKSSSRHRKAKKPTPEFVPDYAKHLMGRNSNIYKRLVEQNIPASLRHFVPQRPRRSAMAGLQMVQHAGNNLTARNAGYSRINPMMITRPSPPAPRPSRPILVNPTFVNVPPLQRRRTGSKYSEDDLSKRSGGSGSVSRRGSLGSDSVLSTVSGQESRRRSEEDARRKEIMSKIAILRKWDLSPQGKPIGPGPSIDIDSPAISPEDVSMFFDSPPEGGRQSLPTRPRMSSFRLDEPLPRRQST